LDNQESDIALLKRLAKGDKSAFQSLLHQHLPSVLRTAERIIGDPTKAEDVAQEVMIRLWKKAPKWDIKGTARIDTWLYRVTVNLCIDRCRERQCLPLENIEWIASEDKTAITHIHEKQIEAIICHLFEGLSEQQRLVIVLSYYENLSSVQIADILNTTPGAVTGLLHRGRKALKTKLISMGIKGWSDDKDQ